MGLGTRQLLKLLQLVKEGTLVEETATGAAWVGDPTKEDGLGAVKSGLGSN